MRIPTPGLGLAIGAIAFAACSEPAAPTRAAAKPGGSTIVELAQGTSALSTLVFAIGYSEANCGTSFAATLGGAGGQYTVFAPTNAAFATLIGAFGALGAPTVLSCDVLPAVLAFHVSRGRHTSTSVLSRKSILTLNGERAAVDGTTIASAPLNLGLVNISASNGIVHVVDGVLLPPSIVAALN
ncbi:MAG: Secreted and surface protein containing fasciclin-like repeats [uncultured Thermoleophilia bacterium]|uniref:Secreted and surface protein containing fasciclin-like repeats n=1 Tax=uncultured Thermoleophilia bacterium TaxID=1497501 RepID=A0A6J4UQE1_9ACTN|nr:MAG: Secreted and surface protein containing fasciclin-like repeats [uncultured Thermoleophilia bacterium]